FSATVTGLRGRVVRDGAPMRWARVVATLAGTSVIAGHAHGDDRGEFLLLINANVTTGPDVPKPLEIEGTGLCPAAPATPAATHRHLPDPLWDLTVETLAAPGDDDPVATGEELPAGYTANVIRVVQFALGKCLIGEPEFVIT